MTQSQSKFLIEVINIISLEVTPRGGWCYQSFVSHARLPTLHNPRVRASDKLIRSLVSMRVEKGWLSGYVWVSAVSILHILHAADRRRYRYFL